MGIERHEVGNSVLVLDDRFFPIVIGTWFGDPEVDTVNTQYAWFDTVCARAEAPGTRVVTVIDGLSVRRPRSIVRKRFAECNDERGALIDRCVVGSIVAAHGAVVLGAITAIVWLMRRGPRITTASGIVEALRRALVMLDSGGIERPLELVPSDYRRPLPHAPA